MSKKQTAKSRLGSDGDPELEVAPIYLRKVLNTSHGLIMRLNNNTTQVYFKDDTELFLQEKLRIVTYIDKEREVTSVPQSEVLSMGHDSEMRKRFEYLVKVINEKSGVNEEEKGRAQ